MFVFLSKLLPLLVYPLGLASVLLAMALFLCWKRPAWVPIPLTLALAAILLASNGWVSTALVQSLEWQHRPAEIPNADAIVLLGGSTRSASPPRPMADVTEQGDRVLYAAKLYQEKKAPLIVASGGRIRWLSREPPESRDMAELLGLMGVPPEAIVEEPDSLNTYQNAVNVKKILQERGIERVLLVTSALHMPRSLLIFQRQQIDAIPAPTDFLVSQSDRQDLGASWPSILLNCLPDSQRLDRTTKAMKEYLGLAIYRLQGWL